MLHEAVTGRASHTKPAVLLSSSAAVTSTPPAVILIRLSAMVTSKESPVNARESGCR